MELQMRLFLLIVFLCSEAASYINGISIEVDEVNSISNLIIKAL